MHIFGQMPLPTCWMHDPKTGWELRVNERDVPEYRGKGYELGRANVKMAGAILEYGPPSSDNVPIPDFREDPNPDDAPEDEGARGAKGKRKK